VSTGSDPAEDLSETIGERPPFERPKRACLHTRAPRTRRADVCRVLNLSSELRTE